MISEQNAFSTFGLNVTDVSFKLAATSLQNNSLPDPGSVRSEEFLNAFQYRDPEPAPGVPVAFRSERARYPFAHDRDVLRLSVKTAAQGREAAKPLNLVLLLDNSGSMERADRVAILRSMLQELARQLKPQDRISVVTFARTAQLRVDGQSAAPANAWIEQLGDPTPEGGTNLEEALKLGYATCARHFSPGGVNRVVLLTDGAANLGELDEQKLTQSVTAGRQQGLALDCFGVGWEGFNDQLLATLSKHGDGRYGFINSTEDAAQEFAGRLAGALQVAASDVKVQVQFNPQRTRIWRQIGYAQHQLTAQQFRDNTVDAAELGAAEAGQALY
ncbi:MAG TPA: von Willebrand factor type A domain-containing protein, partial [Myxococcota bacterium]|nr:von Willebrand factor type A domain-containing protein [Myxococcota bacterium]